MSDTELARAGARGVAWQGAAFVVGKAVVLLTTVLLARLLAPEQFGLVSLALVLIVYAEAVADVGVAQALVYLPASRATTKAATLCSAVFGVTLAAAGVLTAPLVGRFFSEPDVVPLVRLLSLSLVPSALGAVPEALLRRDLRFNRVTVASVVQALATGGVSIGLALLGHGAWSLAWGTVAGSTSYAAMVWLLVPRHHPAVAEGRRDGEGHGGRLSRAALAGVLRYGLPVAGGTLLSKIIFDVDYLVVGHRLGAEALGYYTLAFRIPEFAIINVFFVISSVSFPLYSQVREDRERLRRGYLFNVGLQSLYGTAAGVGLAVTAPLLVPLVFGRVWGPAVVPLVALALYAAARSIGVGANDVYKAVGRPGLSVTVSLVRLALLVPALLVATRWGIEGVAWAQALMSLLFVVLMQSVACRVLGVHARQLLGALGPGLVVGIAVALVAGALTQLPLPAPATLVLAVLGGVAAAVGVLALTNRALLTTLLDLVRRRSAGAA